MAKTKPTTRAPKVPPEIDAADGVATATARAVLMQLLIDAGIPLANPTATIAFELETDAAGAGVSIGFVVDGVRAELPTIEKAWRNYLDTRKPIASACTSAGAWDRMVAENKRLRDTLARTLKALVRRKLFARADTLPKVSGG